MTAKDKAAYNVPELAMPPNLPTITVLPAHPIDINRRALAQSTRYIAARSEERKTSDSVPVDVQEFGDVSVAQGRYPNAAQLIPEEQDIDAAGTLLAVAHEQRVISTTPVFGDMSVTTVDEPEVYTRCEVWSCPFEFCRSIEYSRKEERDKHIMTHVRGGFCDHIFCRLGSLKQKFWPLQDLKNHLLFGHDDYDRLECQTCFHELSRSAYLDHLDDCIVNLVESKGSGKAPPCPMPWCNDHLTDFPSRHPRRQVLLQCPPIS